MSDYNIKEFPWSKKYLQEGSIFARWFIFGEYEDGIHVDLADHHDDIFWKITREKAERLIKARNEFLEKVMEEVC